MCLHSSGGLLHVAPRPHQLLMLARLGRALLLQKIVGASRLRNGFFLVLQAMSGRLCA